MQKVSQVVLGRTGITVSRLAFGAGPVSGLMTGDDQELQDQAVARALACGINWFDTAPGYGAGRSELSLGRALKKASAEQAPATFHIATKVRLQPDSTTDIRTQILTGVEQSLERLQVSSVSLLQLHNGMTRAGNDEPFSVSVEDILKKDGVVAVFHELKTQGLVRATGLTGTGDAESMRRVILSGEFDTIQLPYNVLNPSAGQEMPLDFTERNYGNILADAGRMNMGAFAIRVFAAGAVMGDPPSAHTLKTPFFPLDLYERDSKQAAELMQIQPNENPRKRALRFALSHPCIHSAIIGFGRASHVDDTARMVTETVDEADDEQTGT